PLLSTRTYPTDTFPPSLHDALPILKKCALPFTMFMMAEMIRSTNGSDPSSVPPEASQICTPMRSAIKFAVNKREVTFGLDRLSKDRKSTRLNSSHVKISYAVFCLKK